MPWYRYRYQIKNYERYYKQPRYVRIHTQSITTNNYVLGVYILHRKSYFYPLFSTPWQIKFKVGTVFFFVFPIQLAQIMVNTGIFPCEIFGYRY